MSQTLTDHKSIRRWADEHGAKPARVKSTGGEDDPGILRLDFPGYSGEGTLEPIDWDEWFAKFEESNLALVVSDTGRSANFNKLVKRGSDAGDTREASSEDEDVDEGADEDMDDDEFEDEDEDEDDEEKETE